LAHKNLIAEICTWDKNSLGVAESRSEIRINHRGALDAEKKERGSFYLFMSQLYNATV